MTFPILIEQQNGKYTASLLGTESVRVEEPTRERAVASVEAALRARIAKGELLTIDVEEERVEPTLSSEVKNLGVTGLAGLFADDPTLSEIVAEAYRQRDEERDALFGDNDFGDNDDDGV